MPHSGRFDMGGLSNRAPTSVVPATSPYSYAVSSNGLVVVSGGTVSLVQYLRGTSVVALGLTSGTFPVSSGDSVRVTWAVSAPTLTFIPS